MVAISWGGARGMAAQQDTRQQKLQYYRYVQIHGVQFDLGYMTACTPVQTIDPLK